MRAEEIDLARDRRLVEAWQAGDHRAFDDLYEMYFDRLRAFCQRRVGDPAEAQDLAQEAFVKALQALPRLTGERRFYPWMTVIASRLCIDHHRKRSRVEPSDEVDLGSVDDGHDARFSLQADLGNLDRALARLGPRHVEVLELREREELSYDQIADRLGVPHSTVEALLFRARRALRREFHLVSAERLAAVPGLGWLGSRLARTRDRLGALGPELGSIGGTIAAGAMTAVLVALPAAAPPPPAPLRVATTVTASAVGPAPELVAPPSPDLAVAPAPAVEPPAPTSTPDRPLLPARPVRPMTPEEAEVEASSMPLHVDLERWGVGVDPQPALEHLFTLRRQP